MIFAFAHATLGWILAAIAAFSLRRKTADIRCWAWRFGLLKGPLAFLLAVPLVVPVAILKEETSPLPRELVGPSQTVSAIKGQESIPVRMGEKTQIRMHNLEESTKERSASAPMNAVQVREEIAVARLRPDSLLVPIYLTGLVVVPLVRLRRTRTINLSMPRVEGFLRPRIVVPTTLDSQSAAMALAHEEAHVQRRDPLWSLIADLVCTVFWFVPPVWFCARGMRAEAEAACDSAALRKTRASRKAYANLLLDHAGPAPANALGGPARRLARRIQMLDRPSNPLHRPTLTALLTFGVVAVLPWRAVAQVPQLPQPASALNRRIPAGFSIEEAAEAMLVQPGVKARIGWSSVQERAYIARQKRLSEAWQPFVDRVNQAERTMSRLQAGRVRYFGQKHAVENALRAAGPMPWTDAQKAQLQALALARYGGALWGDDLVARRLNLTPLQRSAVLKSDIDVFHEALTNDRPRQKPMPQRVKNLVVWIDHLLGDANPQERLKLIAKQNQALAPYALPARTNRQREADRQARLTKGWAKRHKDDEKLVASLSPAQRRRLEALSKEPSAWTDSLRGGGLAPSSNEPAARNDAHGIATDENDSQGQTAYASKGELVETVKNKDGSLWRIFRESLGDGRVRYLLEPVPALPKKRLDSIAWTEESIRRRLHLGEDELIEFQPDPSRPGWEIATIPDRESIVTEHIVGRHQNGDGTYAYDLQARSVHRVKVRP